MPIKTFFDSPDIIAKLNMSADGLTALHDFEPAYRLGQMIRLIATNPASFDENCQINIQWAGGRLMDELAKLQPNEVATHELPSALIYRFFVEYDMSMQSDVSMEVRAFMSGVEAAMPTMRDESKAHIQYSRQAMPIAMLKKMLNTAEFGNLRNVANLSSSIDQRVMGWESRLTDSEDNANRLAEILDRQQTAFNFVGLHDGFSDLSVGITSDLKFARIGIAFFGMLILIPGCFDLWLAFGRTQQLSLTSTQNIIAAGVGTLTLTLLLLYFFRISLRKADSCRAQLMQVKLRMSLCKFIQSYADYSKGIRVDNPDALAKFEALIFSGIVGTEEKLPSTFDGIEQLAALAKSIRGKD